MMYACHCVFQCHICIVHILFTNTQQDSAAKGTWYKHFSLQPQESSDRKGLNSVPFWLVAVGLPIIRQGLFKENTKDMNT